MYIDDYLSSLNFSKVRNNLYVGKDNKTFLSVNTDDVYAFEYRISDNDSISIKSKRLGFLMTDIKNAEFEMKLKWFYNDLISANVILENPTPQYWVFEGKVGSVRDFKRAVLVAGLDDEAIRSLLTNLRRMNWELHKRNGRLWLKKDCILRATNTLGVVEAVLNVLKSKKQNSSDLGVAEHNLGVAEHNLGVAEHNLGVVEKDFLAVNRLKSAIMNLTPTLSHITSVSSPITSVSSPTNQTNNNINQTNNPTVRRTTSHF